VEANLHIFLTTTLDGGEWLALRSGLFTPQEIVPVIHCIRVCLGLRVGLDAVESRKVPDVARNRTLDVQNVAITTVTM